MLTGQELELLPYPIDMSLVSAFHTRHEAGVSSIAPPAATHPRQVIEDAFAHWNAFLRSGGHEHREAFTLQATWLLTHSYQR